jgi:AraC family transcriptional regulator
MAAVLGARTGAFGRATYFEITEPVAEHAHPHVHMLFKLGGGDRHVVVEGTAVEVTDGACLLINPWQKHHDLAEQPGGSTRMLVLYLEADWIAARLGVYAVGFDALAGTVTPSMLTLVQRLGAALAGEVEMDDSELEAMIGALAADAAADHLVDRRTGLADYRIRHALRKLRERPHLHIDYSDVARGVGLSRSRFYEQFRSSVGVAPNMFVDGLVLEEAYSLMSDSNRPLDEIALDLGFSAQSSFTRFFRDRVGFPPSTLRRQIERS